MDLRLIRVIGWIAIVHGLSHAVLPMRGSTAPAAMIDDWGPVVLYVTSMIGFVTAGLGLVGLRPLDRAISPLLVLASGLSLVAIQRLGDRDLWGGAAIDVVFFVLGLWRGYAGWPARGQQHGRIWHLLGLGVGFTFLVYVSLAAVIFPWHRTWGSTPDELVMALPGDAASREPACEMQHAITINASPDRVWPLLLQLGRRGATVQPIGNGRALVVEQWGAFVLLPTADGGTRFIVRTRSSHRRVSTWAAAFDFLAWQLPHFLIERRMMLSIKALAETGHL